MDRVTVPVFEDEWIDWGHVPDDGQAARPLPQARKSVSTGKDRV